MEKRSLLGWSGVGQDKDLVSPVCWPLWGGIANDGGGGAQAEGGGPRETITWERPFRRPFPTARTPIPSMERRHRQLKDDACGTM